jgi:hypothetical protein
MPPAPPQTAPRVRVVAQIKVDEARNRLLVFRTAELTDNA